MPDSQLTKSEVYLRVCGGTYVQYTGDDDTESWQFGSISACAEAPGNLHL